LEAQEEKVLKQRNRKMKMKATKVRDALLKEVAELEAKLKT